MRSSDWSSDVCSSDLDQLALRHRLERLERRDEVGQPHLLARIGEDVDQRIIEFDLAVRDAADEMDLRRGGRCRRLRLERSEERRGGYEWVSQGRSRGSPNH